jgi:APA family basic amino acid/polyamine antiporter
MTSIGTLFAFVIVCAGVWVMRVRNPAQERPFRTPWVPLVPILGMVVNFALMYSLGRSNWARLAIWLAIGQVIYFAYGRRRSRLMRDAESGREVVSNR